MEFWFIKIVLIGNMRLINKDFTNELQKLKKRVLN